MAPEAEGLHTSCHYLHIGLAVHHGIMYIHFHYPTAVIPVSTNLWLVLAAVRPPLL